MEDARGRLFKPGGVFLPSRVTCFAALASPRTYLRQLRFWEQEMAGLVGAPYGDVTEILRSHSYVLDVEAEDCHSGWQVWHEMEFVEPTAEPEPQDIILEVTKPGRVHGVALGFEATLSPRVTFRNNPWDLEVCWRQGLNPFLEPFELEVGDAALVQLVLPASDLIQISFEMHALCGPAGAVKEAALAS